MHLQFESVLKYVALPKLRIISNKSNKGERQIKLKGKGHSDLKKIFDWLRMNHVNKIIKVIVVDDGEIAHSDMAIRDAVKGFDILIWDWKKADICSKVIYESAKNVEEITLYSSGNNSVLLGWSSTDDLEPRMHPGSPQALRTSFSKQTEEKFKKYANLRSILGMERVLKNISIGDYNKAKYPNVRNYVHERFQHWSWKYHHAEAFKALEDMMDQIKVLSLH
ncbi:hypothetical protein B0O99DRAFT_690132 [Bisporella sp. PMI_857]|nr:hypothetical protein B0O99DRAFT_690132 [Bisporella sp. PMI_857]